MDRLSHGLVLTAGFGTRLDPLTRVRAKPAVPVAGEPLVRRIIRSLVEQGVSRLVLNLHHLPATIAAVVGDGRDLGATVRYSWEQPQILGSAGGPALALPLIDAATFAIVNGDTLSDVSLSALAEAHASERALVTLAVVPNREPTKYGGVQMDGHGTVTGFVPRGEAAAGSFHFIGVQIVEAEVFRSVTPGTARGVIGRSAGVAGLYDALILNQPGRVRAVVSDATFCDVGTVADYMATSFALAGGPQGCVLQGSSYIDPSATITRSILWDDVAIGPRCLLDGCIVTDGVRVPAGREYRDAVLIAASNDIESLPIV